jgi:hypothetical protein
MSRPSKIYPNWDFGFENKPSGNPDPNRAVFNPLRVHLKLKTFPKTKKVHFKPTFVLFPGDEENTLRFKRTSFCNNFMRPKTLHIFISKPFATNAN